MKTLTILVLALAAAGCSGESSASGSSTPGGTAPPAANAPAAPAAPAAKAPAGNPVDAAKQAAAATQAQLDQTAADIQKALADVQIPTQEDADAAAAKAINEANADAEYQKLLQEIEGDKP